MIDIKSKLKELDEMPRKQFCKVLFGLGVGAMFLGMFSKNAFANVWFRNTDSVKINMNEIRGINSGTINRTDGLVTSVVQGDRTITVNRNVSNIITGYEDSDYEWTLTRDVDNNITDWSVMGKW